MKKFRVLILFAIILIAFGCDDKSPTENDPEPGEVVLSDETVVLEETQVNEDLQSVSPDGNTFTFSKTSTTDDIEEGDILVSGITDLMPNGFLKKVTNVQENSNTITVTTENASLDEALQQGALSASYTFLPSRIENATYADGVQLISNSRDDLFTLEIDGIIYDADGNSNTTDDQITIVGTLNFTAEMLMNVDISNWQLDEFDIQLVNTFEKDLTFESSIEYNSQNEINLFTFNFPVITFTIGLLPVTIHPTISVDAYADASVQAGISFGVTATETMTTGAMYQNSEWSPISSYEKSLDFSEPNGYGSIEFQSGLKPQLQTMIYSVVGPYIVLDGYGKFDCEVEVSFDDLLISEEILFGLDLDAGILIEILSNTIADFTMDIYDDEWSLYQDEYTIGAGNNPPSMPFDPSPDHEAIDVSINTDLDWDCTDPDPNDILTFDVYFGTSSNPSLANSGQSGTTYDPGTLIEETTYYWKIVAHDDHSNTTDGDVWEFTTASGGGTGTVTDIDGNVYQTLVIGDQEWMVENLKVTHYRNGDAIPNVTDNSQWAELSSGAYCYYDNNSANGDTYGALYNWYAVNDSRGLAPEGWHIPTDDEIMILEMYLGMSQSQANSTGWRGTNEGSKLAGNANLWDNGALENDPEFGSSGFSFLPGGYRYGTNGTFCNLGYSGYFWSATEYNTSSAWYRVLNYDNTQVGRSYFTNEQYGFSVRCIRD